VIAHQLFTMLKVAHFRGRYCAPSIRRVMKQTLVVYTYSACLASVCTWNVWGIPFKGGIYQGYGCVAKDYDDPSTNFFWLGFLPLCVLLPMAYVISCSVRIYCGNMLPPEGQRSTLYMYFSLIFVFVFMWLPFIVITCVWGPAHPGVDSTWVVWIVGAQFAHLRGLATVWAILFKPDIRSAFVGTISCGKITKWEPRSSPGTRSRSRSGGTSNTVRSTERTGNVSGSIQLLSMVSQQSRTGSTGYRRTSALESMNEILGCVEPRQPGGGDKANTADKDRAFNASEMMLSSSFEDDGNPELRGFEDLLSEEDEVDELDDGDEEDTYRDNGLRPLQVERYEASSYEEMGTVNPSASSSSSSSDGGPSVSSSVEAFGVNELRLIADCLPTEMQRMMYGDAVTLQGVGGNEIIQIHVDENEKGTIPASSGEVSSSTALSANTLGENDHDMNVDCLPSNMQRMVYEDAVTLGVGGKDNAQLLASINDDESRAAGASSRDTSREKGPNVIADCPPSALQLKAHEDAPALQEGKEILKNDAGSVSVASDESFLNMIANITNVPTALQQMMFEDYVALTIDCSELINEEEEMGNI
jgi:hypothetical protein